MAANNLLFFLEKQGKYQVAKKSLLTTQNLSEDLERHYHLENRNIIWN